MKLYQLLVTFLNECRKTMCDAFSNLTEGEILNRIHGSRQKFELEASGI
jgi:hypothetical protein